MCLPVTKREYIALHMSQEELDELIPQTVGEIDSLIVSMGINPNLPRNIAMSKLKIALRLAYADRFILESDKTTP